MLLYLMNKSNNNKKKERKFIPSESFSQSLPLLEHWGLFSKSSWFSSWTSFQWWRWLKMKKFSLFLVSLVFIVLERERAFFCSIEFTQWKLEIYYFRALQKKVLFDFLFQLHSSFFLIKKFLGTWSVLYTFYQWVKL